MKKVDTAIIRDEISRYSERINNVTTIGINNENILTASHEDYPAIISEENTQNSSLINVTTVGLKNENILSASNGEYPAIITEENRQYSELLNVTTVGLNSENVRFTYTKVHSTVNNNNNSQYSELQKNITTVGLNSVKAPFTSLGDVNITVIKNMSQLENSSTNVGIKRVHDGKYIVSGSKLEYFLRNGANISDIGKQNGNNDNNQYSHLGITGSSNSKPPINTKMQEMNSFELQITMNKTGVTLSVDEEMVYTCINKTMPWGRYKANLCSGIHMITLNEVTGHVMRSGLYMTWQLTSEDQLLREFTYIQDGRLLVFLGQPDFTSHLSPETLDFLLGIGSHYVDSTATNEGWGFVVYKKGPTVFESVILDSTSSDKIKEVSPAVVHANVERREGRQCAWYERPEMKDRKDFCERYGGYESYCSCHDIPWTPQKINEDFTIKEEIPVAIITANRLPNVLRQVTSIWSNSGGRETPIVIMVDGVSNEAMELGKLLNLTVVKDENPTPKGSNKRVNYHVRYSMLKVFHMFPHVDKAIMLEDDLELAPDFISYFHQTAPLLSLDKNILCVNAYNYNAFNHTALDPTRLYRSHGVPAYGWMVTRATAYQMANEWSFENQSVDWDLWIRYKLGENIDIIIPEIPRTKHRGGGGVHVSGLEQFIYFDQRPLNTAANATLDIKSVEAVSYMNYHISNIKKATVLTFPDHPCKNSSTSLLRSQCFGVNDRGLHENFRMMVTVPFYKNRLYIVGCPNSPFCLTKNQEDIYDATPKDVAYANQHPFRSTHIVSYSSRRVPPLSFTELVTLNNVLQYKSVMTLQQE
ncbi:hypothetical protein SK128_014100 [Halocaridina rubra]|uniref:ILEI/PANDER domain-containing protein n=1 Tax=Halocaridina rubra TaxID=373956 RepID=A0AAN8WNK0_HALRR